MRRPNKWQHKIRCYEKKASYCISLSNTFAVCLALLVSVSDSNEYFPLTAKCFMRMLDMEIFFHGSNEIDPLALIL